MVQNIDVAPTVLELAGLEAPDHFQGKSFLPLLKGEMPDDWRKRIYYEYYWEYTYPQTPTVHAVRTDTYKYIRYHGVWDSNELYDIEADPYEMNNLIRKPEHQKMIKELRSDIDTWLEETEGMSIPLKRMYYSRRDHKNKGLF